MAQPSAGINRSDQLVVLLMDKTTGRCDGIEFYPMDRERKSRLQNSYVLERSDVATVLDRLSRRNGQERTAGPSNVQALGRAASVTRQQVSGLQHERHLTHHINESIANRSNENAERMQQSINKIDDSPKRKLEKRQDFPKKRIKRLKAKVSRQEKELSDIKKQNEKMQKMMTGQNNKMKNLQAATDKVKLTTAQHHRAIIALQTEEHSAGGYRCSACLQTFETEYRLMRHMVSHETGPPFRCQYDQCERAPKSFTEAQKLENHLRNVHGKPWQCRHSFGGIVCSYLTNCPAKLKGHIMREHGIQTGFKYRKLNL